MKPIYSNEEADTCLSEILNNAGLTKWLFYTAPPN